MKIKKFPKEMTGLSFRLVVVAPAGRKQCQAAAASLLLPTSWFTGLLLRNLN